MISSLVAAGELVVGAALELAAPEVHHLRVRRVAAGQQLRLVDGQGAVAIGELAALGARTVVRVRTVELAPRPPLLRLVVGAGDRDRFEWLAEKCAELGVTELVPLETALSASVAGRVRASHLEKLQRRALEAIKQSGAAWAPRVCSPVTVEETCAAPPDGVRWLADPDGSAPGPVPGSALTVVVGPEGGLTAGERTALVDAGFQPVRLGPHILRFETAAVAAAVLARAPSAGIRHE